jgi:hypothetical protein
LRNTPRARMIRFRGRRGVGRAKRGGSALRKQYFFRRSGGELLAWDVHRLIELSRNLPRKRVPLRAIRELDDVWFGEEERPTWRALVEHIRLIDDVDLAYPIILSATGEVMDGMHRAAKALLLGRDDIEAVQFDVDPPPDHVGRGPADLPF